MTKKDTNALDATKIKTLIYCTSDLILAGIVRALEGSGGVDVVSVEKTTIDSFLAAIKDNKPQVVLLTTSEPMPNLREVCKAVRDIAENNKIQTQLMLLGNIPSHEEVVGLMNVGVRGYFDLNESSEQLAEALRVVHKEEIWLPRDKMRDSEVLLSPFSD